MNGGLRRGPFLLGLALASGSTLALEVVATRLLSVLTWYSLGFFVIAMGLSGLTAGAVHVYLRRERFAPERLPEELSRAALRFALTAPLSYVLLLILPLRAEPVATTAALFVVFSLVLALPFHPVGVVIAAAVTRSELPVGGVYAADLAGAALGAALAPLLFFLGDAGTAVFVLATVAALGARAFAVSGGEARWARRATFAALGLAACAIVNASTRYGLRPLWVKERAELYDTIEAELWNSHARVEVFRPGHKPALFWGLGSRCQAPLVTQRILVIDGHAATPLYHAEGGLESLRFLECDVTNVANLLRPGGAVAVIGVGGSRDIQAALLSNHAPVVGIELNQRLLEILRGPLGKPTLVADREDVRLVHDDARSYLARTRETFRIVQASLIDTWAATGAGAHALGENGLYTLEAWRAFLSRLEPGGVFTVSRWSTVESARMIALAVAALQDRGVAEPRRHLALVASGLVTTLLVGRDPFTADDARRLDAIADEKGFAVSLSPEGPVSAERLELLLRAKTREELDAIALLPDLDFRPPTDDRPFFFNVMRPAAFFRPLPAVTEGTIAGNLLATRTLWLTVFASAVLSVAFIVWPLWTRARPAGRGGGALYAAFAYFTLVGVGFMCVEIALLQRLSLVLGHPLYGLVVVLAGLIAAAGVGSLLSDRLPLTRAPFRYLYPVLIADLVIAFAFFWPDVAPSVIAQETPARLAIAAGVSAALGIPLGFAFPAGMRLVGSEHRDETPWLWGLNGVGSVLASSLSILVALASGLTALLLVAAACYGLLVPCLWRMTRTEG